MFPKFQYTALLLVLLVTLTSADDASSGQTLRHSASVSSNGAASNDLKPRELKMSKGKGDRVLKGMGMMMTLGPLSKTPKESMAPRGGKSKAPKGKKSKAPKGKKSKTPKNTKAPKTLR
jgi:hypothetical protein